MTSRFKTVVFVAALAIALFTLTGCGGTPKAAAEKAAATVEKPSEIVKTEPLAPVRFEDKWGFIDKSGKTVIPAQFKEVQSFH